MSYPRASRGGITPDRMDRKISVERPTKIKNTFGERIIVWELYAQAWAEFATALGKEGFLDKQDRPQQAVIIVTRYIPGLDASMRVLDGSVIYGIEYIAEIGRRVGLEITLAEPKGQE